MNFRKLCRDSFLRNFNSPVSTQRVVEKQILPDPRQSSYLSSRCRPFRSVASTLLSWHIAIPSREGGNHPISLFVGTRAKRLPRFVERNPRNGALSFRVQVRGPAPMSRNTQQSLIAVSMRRSSSAPLSKRGANSYQRTMLGSPIILPSTLASFLLTS